MESKLYPIGIQDFEGLIKDGYIYVDKTALMYNMVTKGKYYFLSRPRRFGKSLLISTIEAYFLGKKELFSGLAINCLEKEWIQHPVLHLDLNPVKYDNEQSLEDRISTVLYQWEELYGSSSSESTISSRFEGVIRRAYKKTGRRVVVLIDEYDKPLLQSMGNESLQTEYRNSLKAFYGVIKSMDRALRFVLLTGVTKFGKISVFSDLNNLDDITMQPVYSSICGITDNELFSYFDSEIHSLADKSGKSYEDIKQELKTRYDGYNFSFPAEDIYNPFSLLSTFRYLKFGDYWFETGTPTYLVELLKANNYDLHRLSSEEISGSVISNIDSLSDNPVPVLYQSGYLTIKGYDEEFGIYKLGFPNGEVENGFLRFIIPFYTSVNENDSMYEISKFVMEIRNGEVDAFFKRLGTFFADYPYEMIPNLELHYQNVLFIVFRLIGYYTKLEYHTSVGRIDLVLETDKYIYVMEFKLDGTAQEAIDQINRKHYSDAFMHKGKKIFKVGVNFSSATRSIDRWIVETL